MLKRLSSLILAVVIGGSVVAGTARTSNEHFCKMAGMQMSMALASLSPSRGMMPGMEMTPGMHMDHDVEATPGMETMPCCKKHGLQAVVVSDSDSPGQCCVMIPQEPGSSGTTFNLRTPSFSIAVIHPALVQSPITLPKPYARPYSTQVFLPNLQATYIRNLSFLI